jgi:hypothetical protein
MAEANRGMDIFVYGHIQVVLDGILKRELPLFR